MTTFAQELQSFSQSAYVELFEIDTTTIGGGTVYRFIPDVYASDYVTWKGNVYTPIPITITGFEWNGNTNAPPKPTMRLSNVNKFMLAAVLNLGDLVGAKVTRWRTFERFLDGHADADPNAHFVPDIYLIDQKSGHTKSMLEFTLISPLDRQGLKLPRRQMLKDPTTTNGYFPGIARTRIN